MSVLKGAVFMKYRKKPVVIDAVCWTGDKRTIEEFVNNGCYYYGRGELYISTLEGGHKANLGDYIIKGIAGEFYPCKPDIFEKTYEICD